MIYEMSWNLLRDLLVSNPWLGCAIVAHAQTEYNGDTHCHLQQRCISGIKLNGNILIVSGSYCERSCIFLKWTWMNTEVISYLCNYPYRQSEKKALWQPEYSN